MNGFTHDTSLDTLMAIDPAAISPREAMVLAGILIDRGGDASSLPALNRAESILDLLKGPEISVRDRARIHYFRANIWSHRVQISGDHRSWTWSQPASDGEVLELRRAVAHPGFAELHTLEQAQALTNLGNVLNRIGRFVEAVEAWDRALTLEPGMAMANGNRGLGLSHYASGLYDHGHNLALAVAAYHSLARATADNAVVESPDLERALAYFKAHGKAINDQIDAEGLSASIDLEGFSLGRSKKERRYRRWCLDNRLFLNPLNDIGPHPIAAQDVMNLPSLVVGIEQGSAPPAVIRFFNVMKQEYTAARFALHEGVTASGIHFADRDVLLYNTLDYPSVGQGVERVKMAFRAAYALLDKAAFLLNGYLGLGHSERRVSFRNLWFKGGNGRELHPALDGLANWPLRGLYWLSKDVFEDAFRQVTEPDAQALYELRNHLEHKFVSVHDTFMRAISPSASPEPPSGLFDLSFDSLAARTLRQLKLVRAVLIYLAMGIHAEELRRASVRGDKMVLPMELGIWDDAWKRRG